MLTRHAHLIGLAYAAATQREDWRAFLEAYRVALHAAASTLMLWEADSQDSAIQLIAGPAAREAEIGYKGRYGPLNPHMRHRCEVMRPGGVTFTHCRYPVTELVRTEYFSEFVQPLEMEAGMGLPLHHRSGTVVHLSCVRPFRIGLFGEDEAAFVAPLIPHIRQAVLLHEHLHVTRSTGSTEASALDAVRAGVMVLSRDARLVLANAPAERLLAARDGLRVDHGVVRTSAVAETARLHALIRQASAGVAAGLPRSGGDMCVSRPSGRHALVLHVTGTAPDVSYPQMRDGRVTIVVEAKELPEPGLARLQERFCLTPALARVAERLIAGDSIAEMSQRLGLTRETARTHVKTILKKSGAGRQANFIRLALRDIGDTTREASNVVAAC